MTVRSEPFAFFSDPEAHLIQQRVGDADVVIDVRSFVRCAVIGRFLKRGCLPRGSFASKNEPVYLVSVDRVERALRKRGSDRILRMTGSGLLRFGASNRPTDAVEILGTSL